MLRSLALATTLAFAAANAHAADLRLKVANIQVHTGTVMAMLVDSDAAWNGKAKPVTGRGAPANASGELELVFDGLAPGKYAIRLMHDENGNGKLDSNLVGMPTEGYGFSNNPRVMRAATFEEAVFEVPAEGASITIFLR